MLVNCNSSPQFTQLATKKPDKEGTNCIFNIQFKNCVCMLKFSTVWVTCNIARGRILGKSSNTCMHWHSQKANVMWA